MIKLILQYLILLFLPFTAFAYHGVFTRIGLGLNNGENNSIASNKLLSVGYQAPLFSYFDYQLEAGGWVDPIGGGRESSFFVDAAIGLSIIQPSFYMKFFFGPAFITQTDIRLSTPYQFNEDIEIGIKDDRGVCMGLEFKHFSNAGISLPNAGRDFVVLKFQVPYSL